MYKGFWITHVQPLLPSIYAGKFTQEDAFLGTYPTFMSKIALDVRESRAISHDYVSQAGKENNVMRKNILLNIHENQAYLNQCFSNQPFISNPQVEICVQ